jgi:A/G-specific adenine glycosylase
LPGIGNYIASAILSIAFNKPYPAIDVNVVRIISRLNSIKKSYPYSKNIINNFLLCKIDNNNPGDFNQALMDLGRTICKPSNPECTLCPINMFCNAYVNNNVNSFPIKKNRTIKPHHNVAVGVIWNKNKILVSKRKNNGLLGGLWEFPGGKLKLKETAHQCVIREVKEELDVEVYPCDFIDSINHSYSHFSITMNAYHCQYIKGMPRAIGCSEFRWIYPNQLTLLAFPVSSQKIFDKILHYNIL